MNNLFDEWRDMSLRLSQLGEIKIVYSEYACNPKFEMVKRTWKERLFTRPWNPRRKYKQVMTALNPQIYRTPTANGMMVIAHPSLKDELE